MMRLQISALSRSILGKKVLQSTLTRHSQQTLNGYRPVSSAAGSIRPSAFSAARCHGQAHLSLSTPLRRYMSEEVAVEEDFPFFEDKDNLHPSSKAAVKKMGLTTMTEIQAKTFDAASSGQDVLARARTGTGKTMAFLLPALERILEKPAPNQVNILILSPTRELAAQIGDQARMLASTHKGVSYQVMFGGSSRLQDIRRLEKTTPTILVSTPGRLQDHLDNTFVRTGPFSRLFEKTQVLVLDEMDRLLGYGIP